MQLTLLNGTGYVFNVDGKQEIKQFKQFLQYLFVRLHGAAQKASHSGCSRGHGQQQRLERQ